MRRKLNVHIAPNATLQYLSNAVTILANTHGGTSRVSIIGTRHLLIAWHWRPSDRAEAPA